MPTMPAAEERHPPAPASDDGMAMRAPGMSRRLWGIIEIIQ